jgi:hypothetical protein
LGFLKLELILIGVDQIQWHATVTPEIRDFWNYFMYSISHGATPLTRIRNFLKICIYESHNISFKVTYVNFFFKFPNFCVSVNCRKLKIALKKRQFLFSKYIYPIKLSVKSGN